KEQIDRAGFKIQPAEIDALLERHPAIAEACAFGIPDPASGESVAAPVRFSNGTSASPKSLQSWCLRYLRPEAVPERWYIGDSIPRTAVGKVRRDLVRNTLIGSITKTDNDQEKTTVTVTADTQAKMDLDVAGSIHKIVARAWAAVLGNSTINLPWAAGGG